MVKAACPNDHPYPESLRPGRSDCVVCHREAAQRRARARGVPERQPAGTHWKCGHDPAVDMRPNRNDCARCHREREKVRYHADPVKARAAAALWQQQNRVAYNARQRRWRVENLERTRKYSRDRRRAIRCGDDSPETLEYIAILAADPCSYCGKPVEHIDHVEPVARGGANGWENLTGACARCNQSKGPKPLLAWMLEKLPAAA